MNEIIAQYLWLIPVLQLLASIPFFKYFNKVRDTFKEVEALRAEMHVFKHETDTKFEKLKRETRTSFHEFEKELENGLDSITRHMEDTERSQRQESKSFHEILNKLNITLTEFKGTVTNLNETMSRNELQISRVVERLYKDFDDHREATRLAIRDLKDSI